MTTRKQLFALSLLLALVILLLYPFILVKYNISRIHDFSTEADITKKLGPPDYKSKWYTSQAEGDTHIYTYPYPWDYGIQLFKPRFHGKSIQIHYHQGSLHSLEEKCLYQGSSRVIRSISIE